MLFLGIIIGVALGCAAFFAIWRSKRKEQESAQNRIEDLRIRQKEINEDCSRLREDCNRLREKKVGIEKSLSETQAKYNELQNDFNRTITKKEMIDAEIERNKSSLNEQYNERVEALYNSYSVVERELKLKYEDLVAQETAVYTEWSDSAREELGELLTRLDEERRKYEVAKAQNKEDRIIGVLEIADSYVREIRQLMDVCGILHNAVPLYKAIYEIYYKVPLGEMVSKMGVRGVCGIYKITDDEGRVYVGQSVDIGERWKQHVKRGCGADVGTISGSKLYSGMMKKGIWNFRFEVLQECKKEDLNRLEKYWIGYFGSVEDGYNMKA